MYDAPKVIAGLALFLGLATLPFWIGQQSPEPKATMPAMETGFQCVEPPEYMRANHMQLLDDWRNEVVREGNRTYVSSSGKTFEKSLTKTCLGCHADQPTMGPLARKADLAANMDSPTPSLPAAMPANVAGHAAGGGSGKAFCEQCHQQVSVKPYCWACHLVPGVALQ